jgi:hypothetical protein
VIVEKYVTLNLCLIRAALVSVLMHVKNNDLRMLLNCFVGLNLIFDNPGSAEGKR